MKIWKKRLAECLRDINNPNHIKILLDLATIDNIDLFKIVINQLRYFDLSNIDNIDEIFDKVEEVLPSLPYPDQVNFKLFLEKKNNSVSR